MLVPIASYPKSGNTWTRAFLTAWFGGGMLEDLGNLVAPPLLMLRKVFDDLTGVSSADLSIEEIDLLRPAFHRELSSEYREPSYVKVHDRWYRNSAGEPVFGSDAFLGAIHIVRHPAAVALSHAHHWRISTATAVEIMSDANAFLDNEPDRIHPAIPQRIGSWSSHASSWADQDELEVLTVRYEDLSSNPIASFSGILEFAGIEPTPAKVTTAVEQCHFSRLRDLEARKSFRERPGSHAFFREGKVDGWRTALDEELLDRIVADHGAMMARFGYDRTGAQ